MVVVFDAECLLCSGWVQFLLKRDRRRVFQFASIQSAAGAECLARAGLRVDCLETLLLIDGEKTFQQTAAIFRVLHELGWPWRLFWMGWLVPGPLRNSLYRFAARHRYRIFGRRDTCFLPQPEHQGRFL
ncbi:thiol-disulfide oxidoreductase DCC family protein [Paraburkholderia sp. UCT31]|uniref:thiol-disulfide oxidoreductase DCC family protein n=1 Tax=Paraburkholderia sp. UCT31 TaxID=2615209 RepID=UPI001654D50D|nr:thiol-disulfide oxidoreductase DCC family protein [Paraburkholderia sp. UCT31]MBC8739724.1 thiol-disulfide oxidoreductase DCC family protein [Paraburkholderia sp. UCT31]